MLLPSTLLLPQQTISRRGATTDLIAQAQATFGPYGLIVHGRSFLSTKYSLEIFCDKTSVSMWCHEGGEPTVGEVDTLRNELRRIRPSWVAAIGGGSVMDLAKAAVGLYDAPHPTAHYQSHPADIPASTLPLLAAPTTAGTGSEATVVAVITDPDRSLKQSIRHASYMPRIVALDPVLLEGCPPAITASAGLDAFVQAFESYTSKHATPLTRTLSELSLVKIAASLEPLYLGDNTHATDMLEASYLAGLALSHARLGVIHGLAHPLGVRFHAAHGLVCACCLAASLEFNRPAIHADLDMLKTRYALDIDTLVSRWLDVMKLESPFAGKTLSASDREAIITETLASGSTAANPRHVEAADVSALLEKIFKAK